MYVFEEDISQVPVERELLRPVLDGSDITRYTTKREEKYILYPYKQRRDGGLEPIDLDDFPQTKSYLQSHRQELQQRRFFGKSVEEMGKIWFEYPYTSETLNNQKLIYPHTASEPRCVVDEAGEMIALNTAYGIVLSDNTEIDMRYLCALINSTIFHFVFDTMSPKMSGGYYQFRSQYMKVFPIPKIEIDSSSQDASSSDFIQQISSQSTEDSISNDLINSCVDFEDHIAHDLLVRLAERITDLKNSRSTLNLSLPDYLGTYDDGPTLEDLRSYQPPAGVHETILAETAAERENLRIGRVEIEDGSTLTLLATARYKPENPDEFETDRWGYTETDPLPAMEFIGASEAERALISEFVPYAVEEAGGFADFRETATKTNSLLDRLGVLTMPRLSDVESGLERYLDRKAQAEELDEKIEKTDDLIDQIVYELYGLTDEEIEIVEEAVAD